ncbi:phage capsid protein [Mycoplasmatota bacterium]|nr:phage capsid protein [Mycoplasmatota bacterium]
MPVTLEQVRTRVQDKLYGSIIDEFRKDPLLDIMLFDDTFSPQGKGSSLKYLYDRVTTYGSAAFRAINSEYTPHEAETSQFIASLGIFGGSFQIDRVIQLDTEGLVNELAFQMEQGITAARALFGDTFINGDTAGDANSFDGLDKALVSSSTEVIPSAVIDLSTAAALDSNYKTLLDGLRRWRAKLDSSPDAFLMNREMYAVFQSIADRSTQFMQTKNELGQEIIKWGNTQLIELGDKPGTSDPIIPIDGVAGTTDIYAVRIGLDGLHCITPKGGNVINQYMPNWKLPNAVKKGEYEMVAGLVLKATRAAGVYRKIKIN